MARIKDRLLKVAREHKTEVVIFVVLGAVAQWLFDPIGLLL